MSRYSWTAALLLSIASLVGCITVEGVSFESQAYIDPKFVKLGKLLDATGHQQEADDNNPQSQLTGYIVIGTVSAFREFNSDNVAREYDNYLADFDTWEIDRDPALSFEEFSRTIAGWTKIKIWGVLMLMAEYSKSLVSKEVIEHVDFQDPVLFQLSRDLVAARTNSDGALVVVSLLCKKNQEFTNCASEYRKGIFDSSTGKELKESLAPKENGALIDTETYHAIK